MRAKASSTPSPKRSRSAGGADIRVDIIHMKIADKALWGRMSEVVAMIDEARQEGLDIRAHVYPYTAGQKQSAGNHSALGARWRQRPNAQEVTRPQAASPHEAGHPERNSWLV